MSASRNTILRLISASQHSACPCHGGRLHVPPHGQAQALTQLRSFASPVEKIEKEYAFEVCFQPPHFQEPCFDILSDRCFQPPLRRRSDS